MTLNELEEGQGFVYEDDCVVYIVTFNDTEAEVVWCLNGKNQHMYWFKDAETIEVIPVEYNIIPDF